MFFFAIARLLLVCAFVWVLLLGSFLLTCVPMSLSSMAIFWFCVWVKVLVSYWWFLFGSWFKILVYILFRILVVFVMGMFLLVSTLSILGMVSFRLMFFGPCFKIKSSSVFGAYFDRFMYCIWLGGLSIAFG